MKKGCLHAFDTKVENDQNAKNDNFSFWGGGSTTIPTLLRNFSQKKNSKKFHFEILGVDQGTLRRHPNTLVQFLQNCIFTLLQKFQFLCRVCQTPHTLEENFSKIYRMVIFSIFWSFLLGSAFILVSRHFGDQFFKNFNKFFKNEKNSNNKLKFFSKILIFREKFRKMTKKPALLAGVGEWKFIFRRRPKKSTPPSSYLWNYKNFENFLKFLEI